MEDENNGCLNSSVIQKNTPIKRLGLSRKRKNFVIDDNLLHKVFMSDGNSPSSPYQSQIINTPNKNEKGKGEPNNKNEEDQELFSDVDSSGKVDLMSEIPIIKKRVEEKREKLKCLKNNMENILEVENLLEIWKNGCRNAYLRLEELIKEKNLENTDCREILKKLGILETMAKHFENDDEICFSDNL